MKKLLLLSALILAACSDDVPFDPLKPAAGPGQLVGNGEPITDGNFDGGNDTLPAARAVTPPSGEATPNCDVGCQDYCAAAALANPVNRGLCQSLWGVGLAPRAIDRAEACRRLYVDMIGRFPSAAEVADTCGDRPWGDVVKELMNGEEFLTINKRQAADRYLYNTQSVSVERIYDMDILVEKLLTGHVPYDLYAQVAASHPVITRRFATSQDMAEAVFQMFLGRPPFPHERTDFARLYALWDHGYYDHLFLGMRLPDSYIRYRCVDDSGQPDPDTRGDCTSLTFGAEEVILYPDWRSGGPGSNQYSYGSGERMMWSGLLTAEEWSKVQVPGRLLSRQPAFWEKAVDDVLIQYLGYDLGKAVPEVRDELVEFLLANQGDIRSVHFAVATSVAYLQSSVGDTTSEHRWTFGPRKQVDAEAWIDSVERFTGGELARCDHRVNRPDDFLEAGTLAAYRLLTGTAWSLDGEGNLRMDYADLARPLGGCPENESGGRFKIVSILTTATQLAFVSEICDPSLAGNPRAAPVDSLLPGGVRADRMGDADLGKDVFTHQIRGFFGREPLAEELDIAGTAGDGCGAAQCTAEELARVACFSVLSSSELLFY